MSSLNLNKIIYLVLQFEPFHLSADVQKIVFDILEHVYLGYDEFSQTIGLDKQLFLDPLFNIGKNGVDGAISWLLYSL